MLIKSQSEVRLHTGRSVHFHPSRFTRPSFSIFRGSGSETTYIEGVECYEILETNIVLILALAVVRQRSGFLEDGIVLEPNCLV